MNVGCPPPSFDIYSFTPLSPELHYMKYIIMASQFV